MISKLEDVEPGTDGDSVLADQGGVAECGPGAGPSVGGHLPSCAQNSYTRTWNQEAEEESCVHVHTAHAGLLLGCLHSKRCFEPSNFAIGNFEQLLCICMNTITNNLNGKIYIFIFVCAYKM